MRARSALRKLRVPSTDDLDPGPPPMRGRKIGNSRSVVILASLFPCPIRAFPVHGPESRFCGAEKEVRTHYFRTQIAPRLYLALRLRLRVEAFTVTIEGTNVNRGMPIRETLFADAKP
jgi:hypothetical protein